MKPMQAFWIFVLTSVLSASALAATAGEHLLLKNDLVLRDLAFDGSVWRTVRFARADGTDAVATDSDEFHVLNLDDSEVTLNDFIADGEPARERSSGEELITISYKPGDDRKLPVNAPQRITMRYSLRANEPCLRKTITLLMRQDQAIDRLEVERFSINQPAARGGRGEPVFVNNTWFFGVEFPAAHARHTDGNTPVADSGPYDLFGNHSRIDLERRDVDRHPRAGLIRLLHFPGQAKQSTSAGQWTITSKTAVAGVGKPGDSLELTFQDYLTTIRRPVRSFVHYNNWFDAEGKRLSSEKPGESLLPAVQAAPGTVRRQCRRHRAR